MTWAPGFRSNSETLATNFAQNSDNSLNAGQLNDILDEAKKEFDNLVHTLERNGISVSKSIGPIDSPDSIFPNNTFSTHTKNDISIAVFYPMLAENRQAELTQQRQDELRKQYDIVLDLRDYRDTDMILEGTGSLVLDRINRIAYASNSPRTNPDLLEIWADKLAYKTIKFDAYDSNNKEVYHTNVVMWMGTEVCGICLDAIPDEAMRDMVADTIEDSGREIIEITREQMDAPNFAGNALELCNVNNKLILVMSDSAWNAYTWEQQEELGKYYPAGIIHEPIPTIEKYGGGSVRCMIAEIFE